MKPRILLLFCIVMLGAAAWHLEAAVVMIPDAHLEIALREALDRPTGSITEEDLETLTSLVANKSYISDLTGLEHCINLTHLYIRENLISDIIPLASLVKLRRLEFQHNQIADIGPIANLANLESLKMGHNQISDLGPLGNLTNLMILDLIDNMIDDILPLSNLVNLTSIELSQNQVSELGALANLTKLTWLHLGHNQISNITPLTDLIELTNLSLYSNMIIDIGPLANLTNLTILELGRNQVDDLAPLANLTNLTWLHMGYNPQISDLAPLANLTQMQDLWFSYNNISDISAIGNLINLRYLGIIGNQVSDISALRDLVGLTWLRLQYNQIADIGVLENFTYLTNINLSYNRVINISALMELSFIKTLELRSNDIIDISHLTNNSGIGVRDEVDLRGNPLGNKAYSTDIPVLQLRGVNLKFDPQDSSIYTITATAGSGGSISPSGTVTVTNGEDQTFAMIPYTGYHVEDVIVDGLSVGAVTSYTFTNVTSNHTINATFGAVNSSPDLSNIPDQIIKEGRAFASIALDDYVFDPDNEDSEMIWTYSGNAELLVSISDDRIATIAIPDPEWTGSETITFTATDPDGLSAGDSAAFTVEAIVLLGDVNDDSAIRSNDAILALRIAAGLMEPTEYQKQAADMNGDGEIKANDAIVILREAAGLAAPRKSVIASAGGSITVTLVEGHGGAGESVTVPLNVDNTAGLAGGDICIAYDNTVLRAVDVSFDSHMLTANNMSEPGVIRIAFAGLDRLGSKTLARIEFDILADDFSPLELNAVELYQLDASPINLRKISAEFSSWAIPPKHTTLFQNFPNPFNPETWIPFELAQESEVILRIYNASGSLVREISLGRKPAGSYIQKSKAAYWDGKNEAGEPVASGVYFYTIQAGDFTATKKMIVAR